MGHSWWPAASSWRSRRFVRSALTWSTRTTGSCVTCWLMWRSGGRWSSSTCWPVTPGHSFLTRTSMWVSSLHCSEDSLVIPTHLHTMWIWGASCSAKIFEVHILWINYIPPLLLLPLQQIETFLSIFSSLDLQFSIFFRPSIFYLQTHLPENSFNAVLNIVFAAFCSTHAVKQLQTESNVFVSRTRFNPQFLCRSRCWRKEAAGTRSSMARTKTRMRMKKRKRRRLMLLPWPRGSPTWWIQTTGCS